MFRMKAMNGWLKDKIKSLNFNFINFKKQTYAESSDGVTAQKMELWEEDFQAWALASVFAPDQGPVPK